METKVLGLDDLTEQVEAHHERCADWTTRSQGMKFSAPFELGFHPGKGLFEGSGYVVDRIHMNDHAFGQLQSRLDGPGVRWMADDDRCPPSLRETVMNALLTTRDDMALLLRQKDDTIRAVLSEDYTPFDHHTFVDLLKQAVDLMPREFGGSARVHRVELGDILRAWILFPAVAFGPDPKGENGGLHPAVWIGNSEIGTGSVRVNGGVFRKVCSNGVVYGWQSGEAFRVSHRFLSEATMRLTVADAMRTALKMSEVAAKKFIDSQEVHLVPNRLADLINDWGSKYGIELESKEAWTNMVRGEALGYGRADDPRLFDVVNGLTFAAQTRTTDERELMERMAGDLLAAQIGPRFLQQ